MLRKIHSLVRKWFLPFGTKEYVPVDKVFNHATPIEPESAVGLSGRDANLEFVPYDENLLENSRLQWQFGDWKSLSQLERPTLQHHPDRAKLALLKAAGHQALGDAIQARQFTRLALDWGCGKKLVSQILVAGVHNTLGKAAAAADQSARSLKHFAASIETGAPSTPVKLLIAARARHQLEQLGLGQSFLPEQVWPIEAPQQGSAQPAERSLQRARESLQSDDIHAAVDNLVASGELGSIELVSYFVEISDHFAELKDKLTALHFLEMARQNLPDFNDDLRGRVVKKFIALGSPDRAAEIAMQVALRSAIPQELDERERAKLLAAFDRSRATASSAAEHGHELLISFLKTHLPKFKDKAVERRLTVVEIGSTRESVPGQGSTTKFAEFCRTHGLHFITVDMDPHNTRMAQSVFSALGVDFEAVNMKGEDFLCGTESKFDFVFLDAYDFDHGGHSALRQSRYEKYLGQRIDDGACHQMHLDCAVSLVQKLPAHGLVCIDDTWLEEGRWTAKGTLAMPYLLEQGYRLLEARNRAALLSVEGCELV